MILDKNDKICVVAGFSRLQNKNMIFSQAEIIENFELQEKSGGEPLYAWYDYKKGEAVTPRGFLIWSLSEGCGVVYRRACDGALILLEGRQGDFCCGL